MTVTDTSSNVAVATETNAENKEAKPYIISYKSESGGTYKIADSSAASNRTLLYGVVITSDSSYVPTVNTDSSGGASSTASPEISEEPTPLPKESIDPNTVSAIQLLSAKGWLETAYVTWANNVAVEKYNVYYKGENDSDYTKIDDELIRYYGSYYRADAMGLKAGKYTLKVAAVIGGAETDVKETDAVTVLPHTREGFCFDSRSPYYNPEGVGGYKNDGTVKDKAQVIYIDNNNKDSVKHTVTVKGKPNEGIGLANILSLRGKTGAETTPLIIRMIGQVDAPEGINANGYIEFKEISNITFEGVGEDATAHKWSLLVKSANNIEIRNLAVMEFYDDGISLDTDNFNCWVHNCDIFYGQNRAAMGGDKDQVKGDGSLDVKSGSSWITFSFNHFWDCGKTSLCGMTQDIGTEFFVTYHHNWFDHSDSRHPRVRAGTIHIYNNYYDGVSKYGAGSTTGSNLFVESNYFRNTKYPVLISNQGSDTGTFSGEDGGMIKMYGNEIVGGNQVINAKDNPTEFDAYIADARDEQVPSTYKAKQGGTAYNNFDTAESMYKYSADSAASVPDKVMTYAGRMENGDFSYEFNDEVDDELSARNEVLGGMIEDYKTALVTSYTADYNYPATLGNKPDNEIDYEIVKAEFVNNSLNVELKYNGAAESPTAKLIVAAYDEDGVITDYPKMFDINGEIINGLSYTKPEDAKTVKIYIWNDMKTVSPLSASAAVN